MLRPGAGIHLIAAGTRTERYGAGARSHLAGHFARLALRRGRQPDSADGASVPGGVGPSERRYAPAGPRVRVVAIPIAFGRARPRRENPAARRGMSPTAGASAQAEAAGPAGRRDDRAASGPLQFAAGRARHEQPKRYLGARSRTLEHRARAIATSRPRSIPSHHGAFREAGPLTPATPTECRPSDCALRRWGFDAGGERMANHLTPEGFRRSSLIARRSSGSASRRASPSTTARSTSTCSRLTSKLHRPSRSTRDARRRTLFALARRAGETGTAFPTTGFGGDPPPRPPSFLRRGFGAPGPPPRRFRFQRLGAVDAGARSTALRLQISP
jgi:hypothetical protein